MMGSNDYKFYINLFDRNYYTRVGSVNTFNIPGAERSITANLRYDFK